MPGVQVTVTEECVGCGTCTEGICFIDAIQLSNETAYISEACRGCGRCVEICPNGAIELKIGDHAYINQTIARLTSLVDVS